MPGLANAVQAFVRAVGVGRGQWLRGRHFKACKPFALRRGEAVVGAGEAEIEHRAVGRRHFPGQCHQPGDHYGRFGFGPYFPDAHRGPGAQGLGQQVGGQGARSLCRGQGLVEQEHAKVEQYISRCQLAGDGVAAGERGDVLAGHAGQAQQTTGQHQGRGQAGQQQQAVEDQAGPFHQHPPAAFGVGYRIAVGLRHQCPGIATKQILHQPAVVQVLQQFVAAAIGCQLRRGGPFEGGKLAAQAKAHVMGLPETAVVVDRPGDIAQPGQHAGLQGGGLGDGLQQGRAGAELQQRRGIERTVQHMRALPGIGRFDDKHVARDVRRGLRVAHQGQMAHDHRRAFDLLLIGAGLHHGGHIAGTERRKALFVFQAQFQRFER